VPVYQTPAQRAAQRDAEVAKVPASQRSTPTMRAPTLVERARGLWDDFTETPWGQGLRAAAALMQSSDPAEDAMGMVNPAATPAVTLMRRRPLPGLRRALLLQDYGAPVSHEYPRVASWVQEALPNYPRLASHFDSITTGKEVQAAQAANPEFANADAWVQGTPEFVRETAPGGGGLQAIIDSGRPPLRMMISPEVEKMSDMDIQRVLWHELGHVPQILADPRGMAKLYNASNVLASYDLNPYEMATEAQTWRRLARQFRGVDPKYDEMLAGLLRSKLPNAAMDPALRPFFSAAYNQAAGRPDQARRALDAIRQLVRGAAAQQGHLPPYNVRRGVYGPHFNPNWTPTP